MSNSDSFSKCSFAIQLAFFAVLMAFFPCRAADWEISPRIQARGGIQR